METLIGIGVVVIAGAFVVALMRGGGGAGAAPRFARSIQRGARCAWPLASVAFAAACGATASVPSHPRPSGPPPRPAPLDVRIFSTTREASILDDDGTTMRTVVHGVRVEANAEGAWVAETTLVGDVQVFVEARDGWLFLMRDGSLFRAPHFLGEPERVGAALDAPFAVVGPLTSARLAIALHRETGTTVLVSDGGPFEPLPAFAEVVTRAVFTSPEHGLVLLVGGGLALTHDGGRTYRPLAFGHVPQVLARDGDAFVVDDARTDYRGPMGWLAIALDGTATVRAEPPRWTMLNSHAHPSDDLRARGEAVTAALELDDIAAPGDPRITTSYLSDEERLRDGGALVCGDSYAWAGVRLLACFAGRERRLYREPEEGGALVDLGVVLSDSLGSFFRLDATGDTFVLEGACGGAAPHDDDDGITEERLLCVVDLARGRVQPVVARWTEQVLAIRDGALLLGSWDRGEPCPRVILPDGSEPPLPVDRATEPVCTWSGDVVSIASEGNGWVATLGEAFVPLLLPAGTTLFGMLDRERGLAAGSTLDAIHVTSDGGATFRRIDVAVEGALLEPTVIDGAGTTMRYSHALDCDERRCAVTLPDLGLIVRVTGFGDDLRVARVVASGAGTYSAPYRAPPDPTTPRMRCEIVSGPTATTPKDADDGLDDEDDEAEYDEDDEDESEDWEAVSDDTYEDPSEEESPPPPDAYEIEEPEARRILSAALGDATATFDLDARSLAWSSGSASRSTAMADALGRPTGLTLVSVESDDLVGIACDLDHCLLFRASAGGSVAVIATAGVGATSAVALRAGDELAVTFGTDELLWLDPSGAVLARRPVDGEGLLVSRDGLLGTVAVWGTQAFLVGRDPAASPRAIDLVLTRPGVCAAVPEGSPAIVAPAGTLTDWGPQRYSETVWRLSLAAPPGGPPCVFRAESLGPVPGTLVARNGALEGTIRTPVGSFALRCTP